MMLCNQPLWILLISVHLSTQDMVTLPPSIYDTGSHEALSAEAITFSLPKVKGMPTIRSLHITSEVKYRYATTVVSSRVVNPYHQAVEANFLVTLPESSFISDFLMNIDGKEYKAYVKKKEEAKAVYDQAVKAGQSAGYVTQDARDSNQVTVSVNIAAQRKITFNLTYEQLLTRKLGVYSLIININPQQLVQDLSVTVNIEEPTPITHLEIPEIQISNEVITKVNQNLLVKVEEKSLTNKQVIWAPSIQQQKEQSDKGINGQFIVRYDVDRETNPQQILVDDGYFVHFFAPENLPKLRKHVVFVLDYSGSMMGRKLEQLKNAMHQILSELDSKDYFSIVIFSTSFEAWSPVKTSRTLDMDFVVEASPTNIAKAIAYLQSFSDLGYTNIIGGLRTGLRLVDIGSEEWINESEPPQPIVFFLTDGLPNEEESSTDVIIDKTKLLNNKLSPIFSIAFGYDADLDFLRKLSLLNYGFARIIYEAADASLQLTNFYQTVSSPLAANVTFKYLPGQADSSQITNKEFPVYYKGSEIVVAGKLYNRTVKENTIIGELTAITANGTHNYPIIVDSTLKPENRSLGRLEKAWAYLTIEQLLDKADSLGESDEKTQTKKKAQILAMQYSFVTPLTSLVIVKPNETDSAVEITKVRPIISDPTIDYVTDSYSSECENVLPEVVYSQMPLPNILPQIDPTSSKVLKGKEDIITASNILISKQSLILIHNPIKAYSFDYHYEKKLMFYTAKGKIYRDEVVGNFTRKGAPEMIVSERVDGPVRISVDWVNDKLYWISDNYQTVEMVDLDGGERTLLFDKFYNTVYPNNIAVDPYQGFLFFVSSHSIYKSNLKGEGLTKIQLNSPTVRGVKCLALDIHKKKLYYSGNEGAYASGESYVASSDYDGQLVQDHLLVDKWHDIFSLDFFRDTLYFAHYQKGQTDSVWSADISMSPITPNKLYSLSNLHEGIWGIRVYYAGVQKESEEANCFH